MMLLHCYTSGHPMPLCLLCRTCAWVVEAIFPPHSFVDQASGNFLANFVSCVLEIFVSGCPFLLFLICARLLILQSFKMDFGEESEVEMPVEMSPRDVEVEHSVFRIFLKKCCVVLYEMLHSFDHSSVKHD